MDKQYESAPVSDRSEPFFRTMQREMNELFDRFRSYPVRSPRDFLDAMTEQMFPPIDVVENETAVEVTAEVPGVKEADLDISVANDRLVLKGEKSSDHEEKEEDYHLVERRFGSFRRQIPLGFVPEKGAVKATFEDGVLRISIAKPAEAKERLQKVEISSA